MTKRLQLTLAAVVAVAIIVAVVVNLQGDGGVEEVPETPTVIAPTEVAASPTTISTVSTVAPATPSPVTSTRSTPSPSPVPTASPSPPPPSPTPVTPPDPTPTAAPTQMPTQMPTPMPTPTPSPTPSPSPTPEPTPSPPDALALAKAMLISNLGVNSDEVRVVSAEQVEWPSSALGCPEQGVAYLAVIVSGWKFTLAHGDQTFEFHSDESGDNVIDCTERADELRSSDMVNVVEAAGLDITTAIISISRFDAASGEYKWISDVTDPGEIAKFISILDMSIRIVPATECQPIFEMTFELPGHSETFQYICPGINTLLRGGQSFWGGGDGQIPLEFGRVFGPHASKSPLPQVPAEP